MARRLLVNFALGVAAVAAALALAEGFARAFVPGWTPEQAYRIFWQYDPLLGWSNRPGARGVHRHHDFAVSVEINPQGLRDRVYPVERVPGMRRLLLLGDSYTFGFGVEREEIWHELIEARRPGWEIINTGVAGWGTGQELLYYERRGHAFRPDAVLLLVHQTDFKDNNESVVYGYYKPTFVLRDDGELELTQVPVPELDLELRFDRWLRAHTWFLYRLYHAGEFLEAARTAKAERDAEAASPARTAAEADVPGPVAAAPPRTGAARRDGKLPWDHPERVARRAARQRARDAERARGRSKFAVDQTLTRHLLVRLEALVRESGARLLVVSTPMPDPPRGPFLESVARLGVPHLALDAALEGQSDVRFPSDAHWTPKGNRLVADAVEAFLEAEGVLEPGPPATAASKRR